MQRGSRLGFRIMVTYSLVIMVVLTLVMVTVSLGMNAGIAARNAELNLENVRGRADHLSAVVDKIRWQVHAIAVELSFNTDSETGFTGGIVMYDGHLPPEVIHVLAADAQGSYQTSGGGKGTIADRDYFREIMEEGKPGAIGAPVISKSLGVPIVVIAEAIVKEGRTIGLAGAMVRLTDLSNVTGAMKVGNTGKGWICDQTGLFIAHPDPAMIMQLRLGDADATQGHQGLSALSGTILGTEEGSGAYRDASGTEFRLFYHKVPHTPGWVLGISLEAAELDALQREFATLLIFALLGGLGITVLVSLVLARSITRPITQAAEGFRSLATGDADLTVNFPVRRNDETGSMIRDFNAFVDGLRGMVTILKERQDALARIGEDLSSRIQENRTAASRMVDGIDRTRQQGQVQETSVNESSTAVEEIARNIENLDRIIVDQSASVVEASASIEEMVGNIGAIQASSQNMAREFAELSSAADAGRRVQQSALERIRLITERSESLMEANKVIADIASQTNLLAMNAAIEAAHAGDAGRGFAVVADEIRKLAETSAKQSRNIKEELRNVQDAIEGVVESSRATDESFGGVVDRIRITDGMVRTLNEAMTEQQEGSRQILQALHALNGITEQVRTGSGEMSAGNKVVLGEIGKLRESSRAIQAAIQGLVADTRAIGDVTSRVEELSARALEATRDIGAITGRFRT